MLWLDYWKFSDHKADLGLIYVCITDLPTKRGTVLIAQNITLIFPQKENAKFRKTLNSSGDLANINYKFVPMKCLKI